jgi:hypothetical protein
MFRFVLSAIAFAGVLATVQPVFADVPATTPADHAEVAAAREYPAPPEPSSNMTVPVGFGWG